MREARGAAVPDVGHRIVKHEAHNLGGGVEIDRAAHPRWRGGIEITPARLRDAISAILLGQQTHDSEKIAQDPNSAARGSGLLRQGVAGRGAAADQCDDVELDRRSERRGFLVGERGVVAGLSQLSISCGLNLSRKRALQPTQPLPLWA